MKVIIAQTIQLVTEAEVDGDPSSDEFRNEVARIADQHFNNAKKEEFEWVTTDVLDEHDNELFDIG